eukprot:GGOE01056640.1.p1 GENE.GGOE01056640.1~~GGOE01056640.1.p1  ORF type:complete len:221 (+),score=9.85 GGOE01056640.1:463-1125(+)
MKLSFATTNPPTHRWSLFLQELQGNGTKVIRLTGEWRDALLQMRFEINRFLLSHPSVEFYAVTDADIEFDRVPGDTLIFYAGVLKACPSVEVVGPALSLSDIPRTYKHRKQVIAWELKYSNRLHYTAYWQGMPFNFVEAKFDTTFAVRRASSPFMRYRDGFRVMAPYHASHSDWHIDVDHPAPDIEWYIKHQRGVNHWGSRTALPHPNIRNPKKKCMCNN